MVDEADLLLTTAEISVAFAGFSSLVSVVGRGSARDPRAAGFFLRFTLEVSLFVVAFSLVPFLPLRYGLSPEVAWRLSSFAFVLSSQAVSIPMTRRYKHSNIAVSKPTIAIVVVLSGGTDVLLLANALGVFGSAAFPVFLTGLFANLGLAGFYFLQVVSSVFPGNAEE